MSETSGGFRALLRSGAAIAVAMAVMNVATYGYTVLVAHLVGPSDFGAFSAIMGVLLVVNVLSLGLQATGARRISASPESAAAVERVVLTVSYRSAAVLALVLVALAPVLDAVLRLDSIPTALLVAITAAPLTVMGGQAGVLQGERRWGPLALIYLAQGVGRVVAGVGFLLVWRTEFAAVLGVAIGAWLPVLIGYVALRRERPPAASADVSAGGLMREVAGSSQALLAFFALSNADILLARAVLDDHTAGLYAGGLILVKAILFLPQFVSVIAFPSMATRGADSSTLVKALLVALGLGLCGMGGTLLLPDLALVFVGGSDFEEVKDLLWLFALVGTLLSMVQLLLYSALARQQWRTILAIWVTLVALLCSAPFVHSVEGLVALVLGLDAALFLVLVTVALVGRPAALDREPADATA
ncbi:oligosaccharide flippase family protein [Nocardioides sp. SOB77]|uniref:Oligosaccharide flippase family protein n=1 Tax=Nocardioides oceani TaxID=3058369 RepID=A0ABT8FEI6_9ACTN|nr:oligosaccharide flippase family protein [Nocardioides oceani]MDN4173093.1 oligosaccharide flippase family protein [Nocardioides oceani]